MKPAPQQLEQDVLVGTLEPPPTDLKVTGRCNSVLKDLVVLGNIPIPKVVIRDVGLVQQDQRYQLPNGLASIQPRG